jgi:N-acetylmuramoyl-L-alanine amidase
VHFAALHFKHKNRSAACAAEQGVRFLREKSMSASDSNKKHTSVKDGVFHAISHYLAGTPAKSIFFVITLGVVSFIGWSFDYYLKRLKQDSAIVVNLDSPSIKQYVFELDGHVIRTTKTGRVRFDQVRPGHHFLAIFTDDILLYTTELSVKGGEEVIITKASLAKSNQKLNINHSKTETPSDDSNVDIVIDAGHGGADTGGISEIDGIIIKEKFIVLEAARSLQRIFESKGYSVLLTRNTDTYIPLRYRLNIANENCRRLFISLHADASVNPNEKGFSVYGISRRGIQNQVSRLASVNPSLKLTAEEKFSSNYLVAEMIGESMLREVSKITSLYRKNVERESFTVLKTHSCPALLLELGFISNSYDRIKLLSPEHRGQLYASIAGGVTRALDLVK